MVSLRRLLVGLATVAFATLLFLTVVTAAIALLITPAHFKDWIKDSGAYTNFVDAALKAIPEGQGATEENVLAQPGIQAAAKTAFTPDFLQSSTENFIDGTFVWLEGESQKPTFNVDFTAAKQNFASGIGVYALERYNALPVCAAGQIPNTNDVLTAECRVVGVDITPVVNQKVQEITNNEDFLKTPVITADTLATTAGQDGGQPFYEQLSELPDAYRWSKVVPYIVGILALLSAAVIIFASTDRRKGIRRTAIPLIGTAILLFLSILLVNKGIDEIAKAKITDDNAIASLAQSSAVSIARNVGSEFNRINLWFGIIFVLLGAGLLAVLYFTRTTTSKSKPADETPKALGPPKAQTKDKKTVS